MNRKPGDWDCTYCNRLNFASRDKCFSCGRVKEMTKTHIVVEEGDWYCTKLGCNEHNFKKRDKCRKCDTPKQQQQQQDTKLTTTCVVCIEKPVSRIIIPCGHYCYCDTCGLNISVCPMCRANVTDIVKVYNV